MKTTLLFVFFLLSISISVLSQSHNDNEIDFGLGYTLPIRSTYLKLDYSISENSALFFKAHYEDQNFTLTDTIGIDTLPFPNFSILSDKYLRFTLGYKYYFKNRKQEYNRAGWFLGTGLSYRLDLEDDPQNDLGKYTVVSLESSIGYKYVVGRRFRIEPHAAFLFSGSFGDQKSNNALFDFDLYLGVSFSHSFSDPQLKSKSEGKGRKKSKSKKRRKRRR